MAEAQYAHNHVINPETGFLENPAYPSAFNSDRKHDFLRVYRANHLRLYRTLAELGISPETYNKHYQLDAHFRREVDHVRRVYTDELEGVSRENALNPKSVIERIFQLKALLPEKYGDNKSSGSTMINLVFNGDLVGNASSRKDIIDVKAEPAPMIGDGETESSTENVDPDRQ